LLQESKERLTPGNPTGPAELEKEAEEMLAAVVRVRMKAIPNARQQYDPGPEPRREPGP